MMTSYNELHESLSDSRWLFDLSIEMVTVCTFDIEAGFGEFMEANHRALDFFGYGRDEFIGLPVPGVLLDDSVPECISRRLYEERQVLFETTHRTKDGRMIPVETEACLLMCKGSDLVIFFSTEVSSRQFERQARANMLQKLVRFMGICTMNYEVSTIFSQTASYGVGGCVCRSLPVPCTFRKKAVKEKRTLMVLTEREREVLEWISKGKNTGDISALLDIKESTVRYHVNRILDKFNAMTRAHAVAIGFQRGVL